MEAWESVLLAFGSTSALLLVLGFLGKSLLEKLITRDTKRYESELKARTDAAIEQLRNDLTRSVESYKVQLKKSEFFFEREYAAASEFASLVRSVVPQDQPGKDWEDALQGVIASFATTERSLDAFLTKYTPVLADDDRDLLRTAIYTANDGMAHSGNKKWDLHGADALCKQLTELESRLIKRVRAQSSL